MKKPNVTTRLAEGETGKALTRQGEIAFIYECLYFLMVHALKPEEPMNRVRLLSRVALLGNMPSLRRLFGNEPEEPAPGEE